jgi:hypothetical protein
VLLAHEILPLAWAGMPKTSFRKNSDSPHKELLKKGGLMVDIEPRQGEQRSWPAPKEGALATSHRSQNQDSD